MNYDVGVVGAGILGLAHAYHLAKAGLKVIVFERHSKAQGASVRNFGMLWPIGQPAGTMYDLALKSREHWLTVLNASGLWHDRTGSLHLAYTEDEAAVLAEFVTEVAAEQRRYSLLNVDEITHRYPAIAKANLQLGLLSEEEICVDPRQVIAELPAWLNKTYDVQFAFDTAVREFDNSRVSTSRGDFTASRLVVCTGADFREVAPDAFAASGLFPCKLQMMRTHAYEMFRVGPMLAAGLTLKHYKSFAKCPTLPSLIARIDREYPEYVQYGIHVLLSQNGRGEVVLGDSHEYGSAIEPFDKMEIDALVLRYLKTFVDLPDLSIASRWQGVYIKHPTEPFVVARPTPELLCVSGVGGAGMTLSFGLAEETLREWM